MQVGGGIVWSRGALGAPAALRGAATHSLGAACVFKVMGMLESREDTENISVRLGKHGGLVDVYCNHNKWEDLVAVVHDFGVMHPGGLALPEDVAGTHTFVKAVTQFLKAFPKSFGHGQAVEEGSCTRYVFKHILRKIILWAQSRTPPVIWRSWTSNEIKAVTPDKCNLLSALVPAMTADKAQHIFGVNAFMISCWACLFHGVQEKNLPAFTETSAKVKMIQVLQGLTKTHGQEPNLNTLGEEYLKQRKQGREPSSGSSLDQACWRFRCGPRCVFIRVGI